MVAFGTAFALNFLTLLFERENAKMQLALIGCVSDTWDMRLHTTPA
jgi:hypothetical protein